MTGLLGVLWSAAGIIFAIAGKPFIEVAACFLVSGVFIGAANVWDLKQEVKKQCQELMEIMNMEERDGRDA